MAKKKRSSKPVSQPEQYDNGLDEEDAAAFAEQMLAEMGLENDKQSADTESEHIEVASTASTESVKEFATSTAPKRNRRREKLADRAKQREQIYAAAEKEAESQPDIRARELEILVETAAAAGLSIHEIEPDGHCLFASIADQLQEVKGLAVTVEEMRKGAAEHILQHPDDYIPYMLDESTGELRDINQYVHELQHSALWGGELEIMALSRIYETPIDVYFANREKMSVSSQFTGPPLSIAYFTTLYNLGAHYNSLRLKKSEEA